MLFAKDGTTFFDSEGCFPDVIIDNTSGSHFGYKWMQFIGLNDKNKNEIFEGDIVEVTDGDGWIVGEEVIKLEYNLGIDHRCIGKIIGNIHENPELL